MRKLSIAVLTLALLALGSEPLSAQLWFGPANSLRNGTTTPATCSPSGLNVFYNRTTGLAVCTATNTWTTVLGTSTATRDQKMVSATGVGNTAATTDDPVWTLTSIPAGTFTANADTLYIRLELKTAANGNNKRFGVTVGGTQVNTANTTANAVSMFGFVTIRRVDATHVNVHAASSIGGTGGSSINLAVADLSANALAIVITAASPTTGAANDVILLGGTAKFEK